ncbi:hypothetical protein RND71_005680 [Anisodus tanguticus]|uniref:RNase H type-1 domain-containing protein n=1 Tax=Anisodus tanguticus TaxID=243964 RepID=A0AAE1SSY7_9SOLA|nr:hypothetical protein RND71_005680 [Anisodus tanguticus]
MLGNLKARCNLRFRNINFNIRHSNSIVTSPNINLISKKIPLIKINSDWVDICNKIKSHHTKNNSRITKWLPPTLVGIKLNSDGRNRGEDIRGGEVIRIDEGTLITAYNINLGKGTNNWAEAKALQHGLEWCIS